MNTLQNKPPGFQSFPSDFGNNKPSSGYESITFPDKYSGGSEYSSEQRDSPEDFEDSATHEVFYPPANSGSSLYQYYGVPGGVENPLRSNYTI